MKKIPLVKWSDICKLKSDDELEIRDLWVVNVGLLGKWRWWLLSGRGALWMQVLSSNYGQAICSSTYFHQPVFSRLHLFG